MIEEPKKLTVYHKRNRPTPAQVASFEGMPTGFVVDAMDGNGALDMAIKPLGNGKDLANHFVGIALTAENRPGDVLATIAALHYVQHGDVLVLGTRGYQGCAAAGDRVCGMAKNSGAVGIVTDGPMRDLDGIKAVGLPAFCTGLTPNSPVSSGPGIIGKDVLVGGVNVTSGDIIVADQDGVVVVPFNRIDNVISRMAQVKKLEDDLDAEVANGLKVPPSIVEFLQGDEVDHQT